MHIPLHWGLNCARYSHSYTQFCVFVLQARTCLLEKKRQMFLYYFIVHRSPIYSNILLLSLFFCLAVTIHPYWYRPGWLWPYATYDAREKESTENNTYAHIPNTLFAAWRIPLNVFVCWFSLVLLWAISCILYFDNRHDVCALFDICLLTHSREMSSSVVCFSDQLCSYLHFPRAYVYALYALWSIAVLGGFFFYCLRFSCLCVRCDHLRLYVKMHRNDSYVFRIEFEFGYRCVRFSSLEVFLFE